MAEIIPAAPSVPPAPASALRRLPGRSPSFRGRYVARTSLWMDGTQLLQESTRYFTQEIQRFALADIQAIQIRRTVRGLVYNVILCLLGALPLFGLISQLASERVDTGGVIALSITTGVFGLLLLVNVLRGPTCRTVLTTALGPQFLPSLCRMRVARRVLDMIITKVDAAQGALTPDDAVRQVDLALAAARPPTAFAPGVARPDYNY